MRIRHLLMGTRFPSFDTEGLGGDAGGGGGDGGGGGGGDGAGAGAATADAGAGVGAGKGSPTQAAIDAARDRIAKGQGITGPTKATDSQVDGDAGGAGTDGAAGEGGAGAGGEGGDGTGGDAAALEVVLPPGRDGEEDLALEVPDRETFDRLNRLRNEADSGRKLKAVHTAVERQAEELADVEDMIAVDPAGFVIDRLTPELRADVIRQVLFSDPAIFKALKDEIAGAIDDPDAFKMSNLKARADRGDLKEKLRTTNQERRDMQANGRKVVAELDRLIPETITGSKRETLFNDALRDIQDMTKRLGMKQMDLEDLPLAVAKRFREHGIDLRATVGKGAPAGQPQSPPGAAKAGEQGRSAQEFQKASDARRDAAAASPAGAGAPAAKGRPELPTGEADGSRTNRAIKLLRKSGLRAGLGKS